MIIISINLINLTNLINLINPTWQEGRLWLQLPASPNLSRPLQSSRFKDHHHHHHHYHHHHHHHHQDHDDEHLLPLLLALSRISSELSPPMLLHWLNMSMMSMMIIIFKIIMMRILTNIMMITELMRKSLTMLLHWLNMSMIAWWSWYRKLWWWWNVGRYLLLVDSVHSEDSVAGPELQGWNIPSHFEKKNHPFYCYTCIYSDLIIFSSYQIVDCQIVKLSNCQIVKLSNC